MRCPVEGLRVSVRSTPPPWFILWMQQESCPGITLLMFSVSAVPVSKKFVAEPRNYSPVPFHNFGHGLDVLCSLSLQLEQSQAQGLQSRILGGCLDIPCAGTFISVQRWAETRPVSCQTLDRWVGPRARGCAWGQAAFLNPWSRREKVLKHRRP